MTLKIIGYLLIAAAMSATAVFLLKRKKAKLSAAKKQTAAFDTADLEITDEKEEDNK